jgi:predicted O-methyltransferase YrrM
MPQETWSAVERYLADKLLPSDPVLDAARDASAKAGLPPIEVSPSMGKLLYLLARMQGARNILEIGTLAGYSTIWLARALAVGGKLITIEFEPKHAEIAAANIARAGLADRVELRRGRAADVLPQLAADGRGPFDLFFIDADKENNSLYFDWALKLARRGSLIVVDNVVRDGASWTRSPRSRGSRARRSRRSAARPMTASRSASSRRGRREGRPLVRHARPCAGHPRLTEP